MFRIGWAVLVAMLLVIAVQQSGLASDASRPETASGVSNNSLQVMAYNGAPIYEKSSGESAVLTTASCGTILPYDGNQRGQWFHVSVGDIEGWVSGWLATFDLNDVYCQEANTQSFVASQVSGGSYADTVAHAAALYGVSFDWLWAVVGCESTYNLNAWGAAGEYGPFQFMEGTFYSFASLSGIGGNWMNPVDQAYVAAWAFANGYSYHWACA